jgi:hypothetical protein
LVWGTVLEDGAEKVVCRCENYACPLFSQCRPNTEIPQAPVIKNEITADKQPDEAIADDNSVFVEINHKKDVVLTPEKTPEPTFGIEINLLPEVDEDYPKEDLQEGTISLEKAAAEDVHSDEESYLANSTHETEDLAPESLVF